MKPKLLVVELWGIGDLAIATPFLRAATERYDVTLLAKPHAQEMQARFWPQVRVVPFVAPWTAFRGKYRVWQWPWRELSGLRRQLRAEHFEFGLSARPDPRDHPLLKWLGVKKRFGFPHRGSRIFLTNPLKEPATLAHRYEFWRVAGKALELELPLRDELAAPSRPGRQQVLVHSGARIAARVWPLENYRLLVGQLRSAGYAVQVVCDADQHQRWKAFGETTAASPRTLTELFARFDQAAVFIGNCSGPGHLAAISGLPTFTFFGPSLPEWFAPLHPLAEWLEDKSCAYKPCKDYCHFDSPRCLENLTVQRAWPRIQDFVQANVRAGTESNPK